MVNTFAYMVENVLTDDQKAVYLSRASIYAGFAEKMVSAPLQRWAPSNRKNRVSIV